LSDAPAAVCALCRARKGAPRTPEERRARLTPSPDRRPRVRVHDRSQDRKLGGIPSTLTTAETCPDACALKGNGCYAEFHLLGHYWAEAADVGLSWSDFLEWAWALPSGQLWRHNTAGDLPGSGDVLDVQALDELVRYATAGGALGFTFSHKPLRRDAEREAVARANRAGFTVNLSADSIVDADRLLALGVAPVACLVAVGTRTGDRTPDGRRLVVCPAQLHEDVSCAKCGLCSHADRRGVVGFMPHGQMSASIGRRLPVVAQGGVS
jgi:hypothetical protein